MVWLLAILWLTLAPEGAAQVFPVSGVVEDPTGQPLAGATVQLLSASGMTLASGLTSAEGLFQLTVSHPGSYLLEAQAGQFQPTRAVVRVMENETVPPIRLELSLSPLHAAVTVTAARGLVEETQEMPQPMLVVEESKVWGRGQPTVAQALVGHPGLHLQQSTVGQASPFLRGLSGFHVLQLVDGVRFNNSTFRFGPNQYLAWIEPSQAQRVETTLGPAGVEYGSDALGGAIQVVTPSVPYSESSRRQWHGEFRSFLGSADRSAGGATEVTVSQRDVALLVGGTWRHFNDLRPGGGFDSHHALRRFLGLSASQIGSLLGSRQPDTAFSQFGGHSRLNWRLRPDQQLTFWYQHSTQRGVRGYKDLWGGQGRLQASFTPQALHFFYLRHEKQGLGRLDSLTSTFSLNSQRDGFISQGLRRSDPILADRSRVDAYGYAVQARTHRGSHQSMLFGGEFYDEDVNSTRLRALREARYRLLGLYLHSSLESPGRRLRGVGGTRFTRASFAGRAFHDLTFSAALAWRVSDPLRLHAVVARGFRAPNVNDLASVGLQDLGYEFPAESLVGSGALIGSDSGESAQSTRRAVQALGSERLMNYELGMSWQSGGTYLRAQAFAAALSDAIARRTILFPASQAPGAIAGVRVQPVPPTPGQAAQQVVGVATEFDPRRVKAFVNVGRQQYRGIELTARQKLWATATLTANYSFLAGREVEPSRFLRRLPPQQGLVSLLYNPNRRFWFQVSLEAAGAQRRLDPGDLSDERIGAERSRTDIARFFTGDRLRPFVQGGIFLPTGESLEQIQERVLPLALVGSNMARVPLFTRTPGYAVWNLNAGLLLTERNQLLVRLENLTDRNYRRHGSGVDAPGIHVLLGWELRF